MSIKSVLTALIDANIRNKTPKVLKAEHANVEQALLDNYYPTPTTETGTGSDVNTVLFAPGSYSANVTLVKVGRRVFIEGWLSNDSGATVSATTVLKFLTEEFIPSDDNIGGLPYSSRCVAKTDSGIECDIAIGWTLVGGVSTPNLMVRSTWSPAGTPAGKYRFNTSYNVKS